MTVYIFTNIKDAKGLYRDALILQGLVAEAADEQGMPSCPVILCELEDPTVEPVAGDLLFALERIPTAMPFMQGTKVFIPNLEQLQDATEGRMGCIDEVWLKTKMPVGGGPFWEHPNRRYVGWSTLSACETVVDPQAPPAAIEVKEFAHRHPIFAVHVAGTSTFKGTDALLYLYRHSVGRQRLPPLACVMATPPQVPIPGVQFFSRLDAASMAYLYMGASYAFCPSQYEGWGHTTHEALLAGCLTLIPDGAPWLSEPQPGLYFVRAIQGWGINRYTQTLEVDPQDMQATIRQMVKDLEADDTPPREIQWAEQNLLWAHQKRIRAEITRLLWGSERAG